jgi:hypothetical protein
MTCPMPQEADWSAGSTLSFALAQSATVQMYAASVGPSPRAASTLFRPARVRGWPLPTKIHREPPEEKTLAQHRGVMGFHY